MYKIKIIIAAGDCARDYIKNNLPHVMEAKDYTCHKPSKQFRAAFNNGECIVLIIPYFNAKTYDDLDYVAKYCSTITAAALNHRYYISTLIFLSNGTIFPCSVSTGYFPNSSNTYRFNRMVNRSELKIKEEALLIISQLFDMSNALNVYYCSKCNDTLYKIMTKTGRNTFNVADKAPLSKPVKFDIKAIKRLLETKMKAKQ